MIQRHIAAAAAALLSAPLFAQTNVPANLQVPAGNVAFLKARAAGTQNYVCLPGAAGLTWKFQGPQATLFVDLRFMGSDLPQQITTHFLSPNPMENGAPPRATWQSSADTSSVWAKKIAESTDPAYVAPNAIPWFLLQAVGTQKGPAGGTMLAGVTYIQRVNTAGGMAPTTACMEAGVMQFVPYTTDYVFYRAAK